MNIAVIDGQGGGIGKAIIERLSTALGSKIHIIALGTNAVATSNMVRAGANSGATGENAIAVVCPKMDIIVGATGILATDTMMGELSAGMAIAIGRSPALKILIPIGRCGIEICGITPDQTVSSLIDDAISRITAKLPVDS